MTKKMRMASFMATAVAVLSCHAAGAVPIELSYALEDAAFQAATRMNADARVLGCVTNVAFVKLWHSDGEKAVGSTENEATVFETALAETPGALHFVVHAGHEADWKEIDEIFAQAEDFTSWDPKTCPALKKLKLCDAILTANLIGAVADKKSGTLSVRLALRLIRVATAEEWGWNIMGSYSDTGSDDGSASPEWRKAHEACAADAVKKLPKELDGYGLLMLPIEGRGGKAMKQVFLNALTTAGRQGQIRVYDLPEDNAADRMLGRFLRQRAGSESFDDSVLKRIEKVSGGSMKGGKLALMTGSMSVMSGGQQFVVDRDGLPVDAITASGVANAHRRYELTADLKFRDVNDHFRLVASIGASGVYEPPVPPPPPPPAPPPAPSAFDQFLASLGLSRGGFVKLALGVVASLVVLLVAIRMFKGLSRPR